MSSNLCRDNCECGHIFTLGDFRGKPVEFRQYGDYYPVMGVKMPCPKCPKVYFAWVRTADKYWHNPAECSHDFLTYPGGEKFPNTNKGKFAKQIKIPAFLNGGVATTQWVDLGYYTIDLSYYETGRDEGEGVDTPTPAQLFTADDHPLTRWDNHRVPD